MARTRQTAGKSVGGKVLRKQLAKTTKASKKSGVTTRNLEEGENVHMTCKDKESPDQKSPMIRIALRRGQLQPSIENESRHINETTTGQDTSFSSPMGEHSSKAKAMSFAKKGRDVNCRRERLLIENNKGDVCEVVSIDKDDVSDYEKIRLKNIAERRKMFENLKRDMMTLKKDMAPKAKPQMSTTAKARRWRKSLKYSSRSERVVTRSSRSEVRKPLKEMKETVGMKGMRGVISDFDDEEEDFARKAGARNPNPSMWANNPNVDILQPEDVSEEMLANVADRYSDKVYAQSGTTCHQCRQKTTDVKTVCRSGNCVGVRGYFCGICLLHRYGQDAREALKDPNWMCPPCLDVCNCSICRNRVGKGATGPITWLAHAKGFASVKDYLGSRTAKKGSDEFDDDDEGEDRKEN